MNAYFDLEQWKTDLQGRLAEHLALMPKEPVSVAHELETAREVYAFVAGVAACASIVFGRAITPHEAQACVAGMNEKNYAGGAWLVLEGLHDWGVVEATVQSNGIASYPLARPIGVSEKLRQMHNHSVACPGCGRCQMMDTSLSTATN